MKLKQITSGVLVLCIGAVAQAGDIAQQRGYENCIDQLERKLNRQRPKVSNAFYFSESAQHMAFYVNATAWENGERKTFRSECLTSTSGHNVLAINIETGRYNGVPQKAAAEVQMTSNQ